MTFNRVAQRLAARLSFCRRYRRASAPQHDMSSDQPAKRLQAYRASCHCGKVRIRFDHGPLEQETIVSCNCSICTKNGYLLTYPQARDVRIERGEDEMSSYVFASRAKPHRFCRTCGSAMLIDFTACEHATLQTMIAINVRPPVMAVRAMPLTAGAALGPHDRRYRRAPSRASAEEGNGDEEGEWSVPGAIRRGGTPPALLQLDDGLISDHPCCQVVAHRMHWSPPLLSCLGIPAFSPTEQGGAGWGRATSLVA